jgi:hypothetical protein
LVIRDQRQRDGRFDAWDRHQPPNLWALERDPAQRSVDDPPLLAVEVELAHQGLHGVVLVGWQVGIGEPAAALDPEQIRKRTARHQVAMKDRLHLVLEPGALAHDLGAPRDLPPQRLRPLISDPHRRQIVGSEQFGEDRRVDHVGLDLRLGDRPRLHRI